MTPAARPELLPDPMTATEARRCVTRIVQAMGEARAELLDLYERRGWLALGYGSWRECAIAEFGQSQSYLYRLLAAGQVEQRISPIGEIGVLPESQLRVLSQVPPED